LDKAKTILGKLKFDHWKEKDVIEKQISTIMHSQPKNFVKEKSYPFVLMDNCPHKPFLEAKEKNERAKRRELDQLEKKLNEKLTAPKAELRNLEKQEIELTSELTIIEAQMNCCPNPKKLRKK
jgi:DNA-binding transcriptional MerR regulator